jgi:predicted DNA-binding ribbon-helix-helix protein
LSAISVATFGSRFVRKCVAPIQPLMVPNNVPLSNDALSFSLDGDRGAPAQSQASAGPPLFSFGGANSTGGLQIGSTRRPSRSTFYPENYGARYPFTVGQASSMMGLACGRRAMKSPVVKRSVVVGGHKTSVSLEEPFWSSLKEISGQRGMTLSEMVGEIDTNRQQGKRSACSCSITTRAASWGRPASPSPFESFHTFADRCTY